MADATYQPKVYRDLGGNRINVVSGGALNIEAGSTNTIAAVVAFTGANTHAGIETHSGAETHSGDETHSGAELFSGALRQTDANPALTTATSIIVGEGLTVLAATAGGATAFVLAPTVAVGAYAHIVSAKGGSTSMVISTTGGITVGSTFGAIEFAANAYCSIALRGRTAAIWDIIGIGSTNVALS